MAVVRTAATFSLVSKYGLLTKRHPPVTILEWNPRRKTKNSEINRFYGIVIQMFFELTFKQLGTDFDQEKSKWEKRTIEATLQ